MAFLESGSSSAHNHGKMMDTMALKSHQASLHCFLAWRNSPGGQGLKILKDQKIWTSSHLGWNAIRQGDEHLVVLAFFWLRLTSWELTVSNRPRMLPFANSHHNGFVGHVVLQLGPMLRQTPGPNISRSPSPGGHWKATKHPLRAPGATASYQLREPIRRNSTTRWKLVVWFLIVMKWMSLMCDFAVGICRHLGGDGEVRWRRFILCTRRCDGVDTRYIAKHMGILLTSCNQHLPIILINYIECSGH